MIQVLLPFPPSVNRLWRFDPKSKRALASMEYRTWKDLATYMIRQQRAVLTGRQHRGPYKLTVRLKKPDNRHRDLDNRIKALSDALVRARLVQGDHLCEHIDARWVREGPECVVWISDPEPLTG